MVQMSLIWFGLVCWSLICFGEICYCFVKVVLVWLSSVWLGFGCAICNSSIFTTVHTKPAVAGRVAAVWRAVRVGCRAGSSHPPATTSTLAAGIRPAWGGARPRYQCWSSLCVSCTSCPATRLTYTNGQCSGEKTKTHPIQFRSLLYFIPRPVPWPCKAGWL